MPKGVGAKNWNDYAKKAQDFYNRAKAEKLPTVRSRQGWDKIYDTKTNDFGSFSPDGKAETFFNTRNSNYYENVVRGELSEGGTVINPLPSAGGGGTGGGGNGLGRGDILHPSRNPGGIEE